MRRGRPPLERVVVDRLREMYCEGMSATGAARWLEISEMTVSRYFRKFAGAGVKAERPRRSGGDELANLQFVVRVQTKMLAVKNQIVAERKN